MRVESHVDTRTYTRAPHLFFEAIIHGLVHKHSVKVLRVVFHMDMHIFLFLEERQNSMRR